MKTEKNNISNIIETVLVFAISIPILLIGIIMPFASLFFWFELLDYGIEPQSIISMIYVIFVIVAAVYDLIAVIMMIKSLSYYIKRPIKSYQYRVKSFLNLRNMLKVALVLDLLQVSALSMDIIVGIMFFIFIVLIPYLIVRWRINENITILRELVVENLKQKRGQINAKSKEE